MAEGKTWASVSVHTREVGGARSMHVEGVGKLVTVAIAAGVCVSLYDDRTRLINVDTGTKMDGAEATTLYFTPEHARQVIAALESALAAAEPEPELEEMSDEAFQRRVKENLVKAGVLKAAS